MSKRSGSAKGFGAFLLVGGILGTIAGLLLAPKAGSETRKDFGKAQQKYSRQTRDGIKKAREKFSKRVTPLAQKTSKFTNKLAQRATKMSKNFGGRKSGGLLSSLRRKKAS